MGKTTIGKLLKELILETEKEIIVFPKGCIIEVSSEDDYEHEITDSNISDDQLRQFQNEGINVIVT